MNDTTAATVTEKPDTDEAFKNYDLRAEAPEARNPNVRFAFEFQALLDLFEPADDAALEARGKSRVAGITAVTLVLIALLLASLGPLIAAFEETAAEGHGQAGEFSIHSLVGYIATALGLIGTIVGLSGMRKSASRNKWLRARLTTETLRLYHFHHIAARLPEIVAAKGDPAKQAHYVAERAAALERLRSQILSNPDAELHRIITRTDETRFEAITPVMPEEGADIPEVAARAFDAWRVLRINYQGGYAAAKLEHRHEGRVTIRQTEEIFSRLGWACVIAIILIHIAHFVGALAQTKYAWLEVAVIWTALVALAGRAMEDGFQPQREIERYEQYRANIRVAMERFEAARTYAAKLDTMRAFERTSLEEMRVFLRTHSRARFLL